jgi:hypothetical protein
MFHSEGSLVERGRVERVVLVKRSVDTKADRVQGYLRKLCLTDRGRSLRPKRDADQQASARKPKGSYGRSQLHS